MENENNFYIVHNEEKDNLEEEEKEKEGKEKEEEEEEDELTNGLLSNLLNKAEKKNKNVINKKRNRNEALMNNVIELNENYEIISNFAPTTKELIEKLFSKDFSEDLDYNKNKKKLYFNPEEYAKKNNLNQFFFDGEELINSVVEIINEENKELMNNKIKNQKDNLIIEKKTDNELCKNNNLIEIKKEKEKKKKPFFEIKKENEIKSENLKNEVKKDININEIKKEELFDKNVIDNKKEIEEEEEEEKGLEFYDLYGDINREGIKMYLLKFYNLKHPNYKERIKYGKLMY